MIDISYETHPELYFDYRLGLDLLKYIDEKDYIHSKNKHLFHVYTEVKTDKELECIKSFLATQNLDKTELIVWSDYDISDNKLIQPYRHLITNRVYNAQEEAKGTILENSRWLSATDSKHYMRSGILRFLVTHKYGGVWADMDMVFLRDFVPILDHEWAYMWGSETDFYNHGPCAAMMNINARREHSNLCIEEITKTIGGGEGSTCLDHQLLAKVYSRRQFDVYPSTFFNTEWLMSKVDRPLTVDLQKNWFYNPGNIASENLFLDTFAWHWHNSSNKDKPIEKGSKFDLLRTRTDKLLREKGII